MINNPLVSVIVITYNSSNTIIETLDSIKEQTYNNIELIVSDDCSKDDTIEVVKTWMNEHRERFVSTELITVQTNTGTVGNLNRGFAKTKGKWIKSIAGDDILMKTCIDSNVNFIRNNPSSEILLSKVEIISAPRIRAKYENLFKYGALCLSKKELLHLLLIDNFLPASTLFINKDVYSELGGYDERMPLLEDWPFWIKALYNNKRISFNNEYTVYYRISESSISLSTKPSPLYVDSLRIFKDNYLPEYRWQTSKFLWFYCKCNTVRSNKNILLKILAIFLIGLNPCTYYLKYLYAKVKWLNYHSVSVSS